MTEKRILEIAAKMWVAYNQPECSKLEPEDFVHASFREKWIVAARVAVAELQRCPKLQQRPRKLKPHACRIGPGGKRTCK